MSVRIINADVLAGLAELPDESVHCVVTSPPYWGLRDYGTGTWEGGDAACDHAPVAAAIEANFAASSTLGGGKATQMACGQKRGFERECRKCGAIRIDRQIGLEATPEAFVARMVEVFREVRRVMRHDATCWLNLGDSFRNKQLVGIPWAVAKALQEPYYTGRIKRVEDRVWLAAMIDGEGCMFIHKRKAGGDNHSSYVKKDGTVSRYGRTQDTYGAGLEVANTSEAIVKRCLEITGVGSICRQDKDRRQPLYRWSLRSNECRWVIEEIYPHLVAKRQQARVLLGCPSFGEQAQAAHSALIDLHNGKPTDVDFPEPKSLYEPGFYLRSDIIWSKLNPMPESVTDRPTKAHEYLFLLTKAERYYYDAEAIKEAANYPEGPGNKRQKYTEAYLAGDERHRTKAGLVNIGPSDSRNARSVWTIATAPFAEAHFATFPPELPERCIKAGCPKGGTVLDPFGGAGTTGLVADRLQRNAVMIELNPEYAAMAEKRIANDAGGLFASVDVQKPVEYQLALPEAAE
jgi:DNA modification methylase